MPNCVTVKTPAQDLRAGKLVTREFSCPKGTYFWNWSATVAQFVQVSLQETRLDKKKHEVAATFEYYAQTGNGAGAAQVYLGCFVGTDRRRQADAAPAELWLESTPIAVALAFGAELRNDRLMA